MLRRSSFQRIGDAAVKRAAPAGHQVDVIRMLTLRHAAASGEEAGPSTARPAAASLGMTVFVLSVHLSLHQTELVIPTGAQRSGGSCFSRFSVIHAPPGGHHPPAGRSLCAWGGLGSGPT